MNVALQPAQLEQAAFGEGLAVAKAHQKLLPAGEHTSPSQA